MRSFLNSLLLPPYSLAGAGDLLTKFAECSSFTFSAKDINTRKIFIHNEPCATLYGLPAQGLVGMSSRDCLEQIKPFANKEDALKRWENEETKALSLNSPQDNIITILDYSGFVRVRQHLTVPVCGANQQAVAIAAFCYDRTGQINFLSLLRQYQKYYAKTQSVVQLSKYLGIDNSFQHRLTTGELCTLLAFVQAPRHKQAAHLLSAFRKKAISSVTISSYVDRMKDKLKPTIELETVISYLRGLHQWTPDPDIF